MVRPKVKVCGITNLEDALAALFYKADALGFVFFKKSPRYINPAKAANISRILPKKILRAGVFVNARETQVKRIARLCGLNILQFHGEESPGFCLKFKGYKVVKAFRVGKNADLRSIAEYKTYAYLFDTFVGGRAGGTGEKFDWNLFNKLDKIKRPVFLSGGLNSRNVRYALRIIHPDWVDLSSGVESSPGKKDHKKIRNFIAKLK
ncbi:MAG: phosphoribosylanthranilate isomerase [Candidatus Omnitrophota bacterium]|jgi:phosphoribosylanthranilate isomerase